VRFVCVTISRDTHQLRHNHERERPNAPPAYRTSAREASFQSSSISKPAADNETGTSTLAALLDAAAAPVAAPGTVVAAGVRALLARDTLLPASALRLSTRTDEPLVGAGAGDTTTRFSTACRACTPYASAAVLTRTHVRVDSAIAARRRSHCCRRRRWQRALQPTWRWARASCAMMTSTLRRCVDTRSYTHHTHTSRYARLRWRILFVFIVVAVNETHLDARRVHGRCHRCRRGRCRR
jgi:hypothetical protein